MRWVKHAKSLHSRYYPIKRKEHAGAVWGHLAIYHGGVSYEKMGVLDDLLFFEVQENKWHGDRKIYLHK